MDDARRFATAYRSLAAAQKGRARGAPAYSLYVNRPIGRVLAAAAFRIGATPDAVSLASIGSTVAGLVVLLAVPPALWQSVLVALLLVLGYALDSADGQLARLRGGGSVAGEWLDHVLDSFKIAAVHITVFVAAWLWTPASTWMLAVPLLFAIVAVTTFAAMLLNDLLKQREGVSSTHARGGGGSLRSFIVLPTDYGVLCLVFCTWFAWPVFGVLYAAIFVASTLFTALALPKWYRDMRGLRG